MIQILRLYPAENSYCFSKRSSPFKSVSEDSANMNELNNLESFFISAFKHQGS